MSGGTELNQLEMNEGSVTAPKVIADNERQFRAMYNNLALDHKVRFSEFAKIQGQYFLYRPRDPKKLKEIGREWLSNINNGHSRNLIHKYFTAEFNLVHGVASPIDIQVNLFKRSGAPNGAEIDNRISGAMKRAFKDVYAEWEDFYVNLDSMRLDRILFGTGILLREFSSGDLSWKFRSISPDQFLAPKSVELRRGSLSKFCIVHTMPASELWALYEEDAPYWDKEALGYVLWRASMMGSSNRGRGFEDRGSWYNSLLEMQRKLRNYSACLEEMYNDDVKLVSVYVKEWDGKWSHGIIHESYHTEKPLFFRAAQYDDLDDFCQIWTFEPGQRFLHSVRGLGYRIFQPVEAQNRLDNILIDQAHLASTVFVRTRAGRGKDAKSISIVPGAVNDIGEAEFIQQLQAGNLNASIAVNQYQGQILEKNNQFEQFDIENPDNKYRTLGEVGMLATQDSVINKPQVNWFYTQYDAFFVSSFKLMYKRKKDEYFKEWRSRVEFEIADLKLPSDILEGLFKLDNVGLNGLPKWLKVKASRSTSSGSQVADIMAVNRMMSLTPFMTTDKRHVFLRRATAAYSDFADVDLYFPESDRPDIFTEPMQKAVIENGLLVLGNEIPVSPNDSHRDECGVHFNKCVEIIQAWGSSQIGAIQARDQLAQLYPHGLAHYIALSQDPWSKAIYDGLAPIRGQIENQFRLISANAIAEEKAIAAEEQRRRLELAQVQLDNDPKRLKVVLEQDRKEREFIAKERREAAANNLQNIKFAVKQDLENELELKDFALTQARKDLELQAKINATRKS